MNALASLKVSHRLALGFGLVLLLLCAVMAITAWRLSSIGGAFTQLVGEEWAQVEAVSSLEAATRANASRTLELLVTPSAERLAWLRERIAVNRGRAPRRSPRCSGWPTRRARASSWSASSASAPPTWLRS